jgi:hypothetical protein
MVEVSGLRVPGFRFRVCHLEHALVEARLVVDVEPGAGFMA